MKSRNSLAFIVLLVVFFHCQGQDHYYEKTKTLASESDCSECGFSSNVSVENGVFKVSHKKSLGKISLPVYFKNYKVSLNLFMPSNNDFVFIDIVKGSYKITIKLEEDGSYEIGKGWKVLVAGKLDTAPDKIEVTDNAISVNGKVLYKDRIFKGASSVDLRSEGRKYVSYRNISFYRPMWDNPFFLDIEKIFDGEHVKGGGANSSVVKFDLKNSSEYEIKSVSVLNKNEKIACKRMSRYSHSGKKFYQASYYAVTEDLAIPVSIVVEYEAYSEIKTQTLYINKRLSEVQSKSDQILVFDLDKGGYEYKAVYTTTRKKPKPKPIDVNALEVPIVNEMGNSSCPDPADQLNKIIKVDDTKVPINEDVTQAFANNEMGKSYDILIEKEKNGIEMNQEEKFIYGFLLLNEWKDENPDKGVQILLSLCENDEMKKACAALLYKGNAEAKYSLARRYDNAYQQDRAFSFYELYIEDKEEKDREKLAKAIERRDYHKWYNYQTVTYSRETRQSTEEAFGYESANYVYKTESTSRKESIRLNSARSRVSEIDLNPFLWYTKTYTVDSMEVRFNTIRMLKKFGYDKVKRTPSHERESAYYEKVDKITTRLDYDLNASEILRLQRNGHSKLPSGYLSKMEFDEFKLTYNQKVGERNNTNRHTIHNLKKGDFVIIQISGYIDIIDPKGTKAIRIDPNGVDKEELRTHFSGKWSRFTYNYWQGNYVKCGPYISTSTSFPIGECTTLIEIVENDKLKIDLNLLGYELMQGYKEWNKVLTRGEFNVSVLMPGHSKLARDSN